MGKIRVLPDHVANQIAAGEVVERPSSVVKELVENSIDAGAARLQIELEQSGRGRITVIDDGHGMSPSDVELAVTRHATSKLQALADLEELRTLGFRGEALPSISSVSKMTVVSRRPQDTKATKLTFEGGKLRSQEPVGAPVGTRIDIENLLYNVPARQKFLKGDATEMAHINDSVQKLALAHPGIDFELKHKGRTSLHTPSHVSDTERVLSLLGKRTRRNIHRQAGKENGVEVRAFLAPPECAQSTARGIQVFVGRRAVKDRGIVHAITRGYGELLAKKYPLAVVFIEVPGEDIDVNVHPQKSEVRFSKPQEVYSAVRHIVARGVADASWLDRSIQSWGGEGIASRPKAAHIAWLRQGEKNGGSGKAFRLDNQGVPKQQTQRSLWAPPPSSSTPLPTLLAKEDRAESSESDKETGLSVSHGNVNTWRFADLTFLGQFHGTFLVCQGEEHLVVLDQHAAHERVLYEDLKHKAESNGGAPSQALLIPTTVEVESHLGSVVSDSQDEIEGLGFALELFGENSDGTISVAIKAAALGTEDKVRLVVPEILEDLYQLRGPERLEKRRRRALATIACHSAIRKGDRVTEEVATKLLSQLDGIDHSTHCPHGRPTYWVMGASELGKKFDRFIREER